MNLHIFNDPVGFFSNKTASYLNSIQPGNNLYLNTAPLCKHKIEGVVYMDAKTFFQQNRQELQRVIFHSYSYSDSELVELIRSKNKDREIFLVWLFWSHEYYQLPEFFSKLYQGFSRKFYLRKILSFHAEQVLLFLKGKSGFPFYKGLSAFKKTFKEFDLFAAFLEGDYDVVMKGNSKASFSFSSYLTVADFPDIPNDFSEPKNDIMIGHSGSPIVNHYEIAKQLSDMKIDNTILIPLSYGKPAYIKGLQEKIKELGNDHISLITEYLSKDEYYKKIHHVGYFILNSYCQQALGNIVFFLWTGTKIFLRENTSTYQTLKKQSFHVYSIERDLNKQNMTPLSLTEKQHNYQLICALISEENVKAHWLKILNFDKSAAS